VEALKTELESTFKEEISIYFDINPHDGLLETHDVYDSLKAKLNSLVFIPIISRTYCDPKSFAWEHEFMAYLEQASHDQFGLKVKLPNGNVANRVLPVRIHDLNPEDKALVEKELGGYLRAVEFIYKEAGVNRPLKPDDDDRINLNKTKYRNQVNKTANAIDEIINSLKNISTPAQKGKTLPGDLLTAGRKDKREEWKKKKPMFSKWKSLAGSILVLFAIIALINHLKLFEKDKLDKIRSSDGRIAVAIMPFQNMTNDTTWNVWQIGIQDILVSYLSNSPEELKVRQTESINDLIQSKGLTQYASITPSFASDISQKLEASIFISGSIKQAGSTIRLNVQMIDPKTQETFKSFEIDGPAREDKIFQITDSLKRMVKDFLLISKLTKELSPEFQQVAFTVSPEAYKCFIYGENARRKGDHSTTVKMYSQAIAIDSNFTFATAMLSVELYNRGLYDSGRKLCLKVYRKRDQMTMQQKIWINRLYAMYFETPAEEIQYLRQLLEIDDQMPFIYYAIGYSYNKLYQYDKAIPEFEKSLAIYEKRETKPYWVSNYVLPGIAYTKTNQYGKAKEIYLKAAHDFPNFKSFNYRLAILSLLMGKTKEANEYIEKFQTILKQNSVPEAEIVSSLGDMYIEADLPVKAIEYYRKALSLEPRNLFYMNNLAFLLIDSDLNVNEGMKLIEEAYRLNLDMYYYVDCKGWGLYKQGNYKEALRFLEKSDSLKPVYDHALYLHLEAARKAVANQKL